MMKNDLIFDSRAVRVALRKHESFYLYDESVILGGTERLKRDFPGMEFLYSLKANPARRVAECVFKQGFGADAASLAEVRLAASLGAPRELIQYSAPGKSYGDIAAALPMATVTADSANEVALIEKAAAELGIKADIGIRINPDFTYSGTVGAPGKFGMDESVVLAALDEWKAMEHVRIRGIHVHLRSQELSAAVLERYYENMFALAERMQRAIGTELRFLNLGSGIGIPFSPNDRPVDTASLGRAAAGLMERYRTVLPGARVLIETGRFAVGKSGVYVTRVMDKKVSHGVTFVILKNTLNGFIRPSVAQMVLAIDPDAAPSEPLYTGRDAFPIAALSDAKEQERVTLVGNLCTGTDVIARDILLPRLSPGDAVIMGNAGCYAAVVSPMQFSSQTPPAQLFLTVDGELLDAEE